MKKFYQTLLWSQVIQQWKCIYFFRFFLLWLTEFKFMDGSSFVYILLTFFYSFFKWVYCWSLSSASSSSSVAVQKDFLSNSNMHSGVYKFLTTLFNKFFCCFGRKITINHEKDLYKCDCRNENLRQYLYNTKN